MTGFFRPRSSNKYLGMRGVRGLYNGIVPPHVCPETGENVSYYTCASECTKWGIHTEGDVHRCKYEYEELKSSGFYARTEDEWLEHLQVAEPDTYRRLIEEKREKERVIAEMEAERSDAMGQAKDEEQEKQEDTENDDENEQEELHDEDDEDEGDEEEDEDNDWW
jgi:hypothetical protein